MVAVILGEDLSHGDFVGLSQGWVIVNFLEELSCCIGLIIDLFDLSLESSPLSSLSLVVVDLLEACVLPDTSQDFSLIVGDVIDNESGKLVSIVSLFDSCGDLVLIHLLY